MENKVSKQLYNIIIKQLITTMLNEPLMSLSTTTSTMSTSMNLFQHFYIMGHLTSR